MILIRYRGGLGNQMFQYAFQLAVQQKYTDVSVLADLSHYTLNHEHNGLNFRSILELNCRQLRKMKSENFRPIMYHPPLCVSCLPQPGIF